MATTTNGIYYPNDYDSVADIPEDMKKMAESVDTKIAENKTEIDNIKTEQTTQNTNISNLQKDNTTNKQDITEIKAKDTDQDKYIAELEAENSRLREDLNGLPKGQESGESIDLNDSAEMRCDLKISGNSKQETREGYNLFNANIPYTTNSSGETIKWQGIDRIPSLEVNKSYYIYGKCSDGTKLTPSNSTFVITNESGQILNKGFGMAFTNTVDISSANNCYIWTNSSLAGKEISKLAIYEGTEEKEYEQYGAMPSPNYPSEVESCGDNINLYNQETTLVNKWIDDNGKPVWNDVWNSGDFIKVNPNSNIAFSSITDSTSPQIIIAQYNNSKEFITKEQINNKTSGTIKLVTTTSYIRFGYRNDKNISNIKLIEGTETGEYSTYGQGCINEVICNGNLFNTDVEQGSVSTDTGEKISSEYSIRTEFIRVTPNKEYILKYSTDLTSDYNTKIVEFDKNKAFLKTTVALPPNKKLSITTNNQTEYVIIAIYSGTKLSPLIYTNYFKNIEFKQNDGSEYIEHKSQTYTIPTQQPFRANGTIRDTFIKKDGKRYERHYIERKIFDGTEEWQTTSIAWDNKDSLFYISMKDMIVSTDYDNTFPLLSSHYQNVINFNHIVWSGRGYQNAISTYSGTSIYILDKRYTNVNDFKNWLTEQYNAGTPVYVDYILETPLDIECTEEQSTILDQIENEAKTYDKVTHMYSTDKISSYKDVTYKIDLETRLNNIEQAILSQGGNI